ncbi:MAG: CopG family transcriptional regulator [Micrococcales bacterium]|nr:CopG family transcriptional regulator [Micrococcales bacterium]
MSARGGSTSTLSVSLPTDVVDALKVRAGPRGVSAYVTEAVRHKLAMEGLDEIVQDYEATRGPVDQTLVDRFTHDFFSNDPDT